MPYLGLIIDSERQAFILLSHKKGKLIRQVKEILPRDCLDLLTLQRLSGECMSMSLAVPGARLYVNEINLAISGATPSWDGFPGGLKSTHMSSYSPTHLTLLGEVL